MTGVSPTLLARACSAAAQVLDRHAAVRLWTAPAQLRDGVPVLAAGASRPFVLTADNEGDRMRWRALVMPVRVGSEENG